MTYSSIADLVSQIQDGAIIALPAEYSFVPMELVRGLIASEVKGLQLLCVPIGGLATDMLIRGEFGRGWPCAQVWCRCAQ